MSGCRDSSEKASGTQLSAPPEPALEDCDGAGKAEDAPAPSASPEGDVVTYAPTSLGLKAASLNGRIQPRGAPAEYFFEIGPTTGYGRRTLPKKVAPRLAAYYRETWDKGLAGFQGGSGNDLVHVPDPESGGGFVRYTEPTGDDYNHADGIGLLHLVQWFYPGVIAERGGVSGALGGGAPDFRDARVRVKLRGNAWQTSGTELYWWSQIDITHGRSSPEGTRFANWAHTGVSLTDALFSGKWETVEYRLYNDTTQWTYAGSNRALDTQQQRSVYAYTPIDDVLSNLDVDFLHVLAPVDVNVYPSGSIDFDELEIAYRNHSVLLPSNGGKLVSATSGSPDDPSALTDGWRNGNGRMWASALSPQSPVELVYDFARPVLVEKVQLHQHTEFPAKDIEVLATADGATWVQLVTGPMPENSAAGANFAYRIEKDLNLTKLAQAARSIKVRILSGYRSERWGLGEIEIFGSGALQGTDDDWYRVNADVADLEPGVTYHARLVAVIGGRTESGGDMTFRTPSTPRPEVATGTASRITASTAKVEGRANTLGTEAQAFFEFGADTAYGFRTPSKRMGPEITPRTFVETLSGLAAGTTVHYRLVVAGSGGTRCGKDLTFVAR